MGYEFYGDSRRNSGVWRLREGRIVIPSECVKRPWQASLVYEFYGAFRRSSGIWRLTQGSVPEPPFAYNTDLTCPSGQTLVLVPVAVNSCSYFFLAIQYIF